jgi:hypothetical protein
MLNVRKFCHAVSLEINFVGIKIGEIRKEFTRGHSHQGHSSRLESLYTFPPFDL